MNNPLPDNLSILVVEDDPGDFGLVRVHIRQAGYDRAGGPDPLTWAQTLAEGIAAAQRVRPDVVLLDLSLPDSSGLDTVRAMHAALPEAPIVVLSGNDERSLALNALEAGAQDYLVKGQFDHDMLGRALRYALVRGKLELRLRQHQQHLEEMVRARTVELARALEAAKTASHAKSIFLANMSHELRTPMNGIMGMTALAIRRATDPKQLDYLQKVDVSAQRLLGVLNNVLEIAKIETGTMVLAAQPFDSAALLSDVRAKIDGPATAKGLVVACQTDPALPPLLLGDAERIKQVLLHLADNAVKFTTDGMISLGARLEGTAGTTGGNSGGKTAQVRFVVADSGCGIAPEHIDRVFQAFEQADNSATRVHGGTGLGLAISRSLVELMGGKFEVSSTPGAGSTFSFLVSLSIP